MTDNEPLDPRLQLDGEVDFTMMYVAHDAFSRDLRTLASGGGHAWTVAEQDIWGVFTTQLHIHHHAEDVALWPALRGQGLTPAEIGVLDDMEEEHAQIDPHLEQLETAIGASDVSARDDALRRLSSGLAVHMRHEENSALPLIERYLGPTGWGRFTGSFRETQGIRGAAAYFPWLLEGATPEVRRKVLAVLPPPARLLYRWRWEPAYLRARPGSTAVDRRSAS